MIPILREALDSFFESERVRFLSRHTRRALQLDLTDFIHHMIEEKGNKEEPDEKESETLLENVLNATSVDLKNYLVYLGQSAPATIARKFTSVRKFLTWAHKKSLRKKPLPDFPKLPTSQKLAPRSLTKTQVDALLRRAEQRNHTTSERNVVIIKLLLHTGLRVGELVNLTWDDVTLSRYAGHLNVIGGKGQKDRVVPLNSTIRSVLLTYKKYTDKHNKEGGYLFIGSRGQLKEDAILRIFYKLSEDLKISPKITPHSLRHTFCKSLLDKGVSLTEISALAGHASLTTTQRYVVPSLEDVARSVEKIADI